MSEKADTFSKNYNSLCQNINNMYNCNTTEAKKAAQVAQNTALTLLNEIRTAQRDLGDIKDA